MNNFIEKLQEYHNAGYSGVYVVTHEEARVCLEIAEMVKKSPNIALHEWDAQNFLRYITGDEPVKHPEIKNTEDLVPYIQNYRVFDEDNQIKDVQNIFVLKDFHGYFDRPRIIRMFRNSWNILKRKRDMIVFIGYKFGAPPELHKEVQLMDYSLPDTNTIKQRLEYIQNCVNSSLRDENRPELTISSEIAEAAVEAAKGMTYNEIENAFALASSSAGEFNNKFVEIVFQEKIAHLKKNGLLTYMEPNVSFADVGGLTGLKKWLTARKKAYSQEARAYKLPLPKGMLLASVPGTGKSLICKAIAKEFDCPLFALDIGSLFDSLVGNTEKNMREMIKTVESIGKCVILID